VHVAELGRDTCLGLVSVLHRPNFSLVTTY
jgi:hypothetical protein